MGFAYDNINIVNRRHRSHAEEKTYNFSRAISILRIIEILLISIFVYLIVFLTSVKILIFHSQAWFSTPQLAAKICIILSIVVFVKWVDKAQIDLVLGSSKKFFLKKVVRGLMLGIVVSILLLYFSNSSQILFKSFKIEPFFVFGLLITSFVQASSEELLFRGYVLKRLSNVLNIWWGIVISSILFAVFHIWSPFFNFLFFFNIFLFGVFASLYKTYFDKGSIWGACGFHTGWNLIILSPFVTGYNIESLYVSSFVLMIMIVLLVGYIKRVEFYELISRRIYF